MQFIDGMNRLDSTKGRPGSSDDRDAIPWRPHMAFNTSFGRFSIRSTRLALALGAIAGLAWSAPSALAKVHLKISANSAAIDGFENWTAASSWDQIQTFKNANAARPVVDLVLELQALKAGGLDFDFELVRALTYEQAKVDVIEGRADLTAETIWDDEIAANSDKLLKTDAIIRNGEFVKGIYVLPSNSELLKLSSAEELRACVGAVVSSWALDVKSMERMQLKGLVKTVTPEIAFAKIQARQADFTLAEFSSSPDMSVEQGGVRLVPVPRCKVAIMGSRSWIVSKASPQADALLEALVAGIRVLRDNGTIDRAYKESGFFNPRVSDWNRLF